MQVLYFFPNVEARDENGQPRGGLIRTSIGKTIFPGSPLVNLESQNVKTTVNQILATPYLEFRPWEKITLRTEFGTQIMDVEDFWKGSSVGTGGYDPGRVEWQARKFWPGHGTTLPLSKTLLATTNTILHLVFYEC
jgi:hypothetical protein